MRPLEYLAVILLLVVAAEAAAMLSYDLLGVWLPDVIASWCRKARCAVVGHDLAQDPFDGGALICGYCRKKGLHRY